MKPLFTENQFNAAKSTELLPCECYVCGETFFPAKKRISRHLKGISGCLIKYCSAKCSNTEKATLKIFSCKNCNKSIRRNPKDIQKYRNFFCSSSCSATYNNKHKVKGTRRSKLEFWLELKLKLNFPDLIFYFNETTHAGFELDIYIPNLNLAFELNGIFHYEPIYGINKLQSIQRNDLSKSKICHDLKIDLCIINTCSQRYFTEKSSKQYLDIITNIITERLILLN